jgi:hypothetical protein
MSRTIRRKDYIPFWVKGEWQGSRFTGEPKVFVLYEGEQAKKELVRYHSDAGCPSRSGPHKWFRNSEQQIYRAKSKAELVKYLRNPEYEVMILANPKLPYWD